jgi:hypothetical protein
LELDFAILMSREIVSTPEPDFRHTSASLSDRIIPENFYCSIAFVQSYQVIDIQNGLHSKRHVVMFHSVSSMRESEMKRQHSESFSLSSIFLPFGLSNPSPLL